MKNLNDASSHLMEHLAVGVLLFNENDILVYINNAAEELLDISKRKVLGLESLKVLHMLDYDVKCGFKRCKEAGSKVTKHLISANILDGGKKHISLSMTPLSLDADEEGTLVEVFDLERFIHIDNDEKLLFQHELATDMLRGVAHEVKNPLGGIRGAAQLLAKELNGDYSDYIEVIISEADRLRTLVDRMLGSSELPNHQDTNIHVIIERVRQLVQAEVGDNISIKADYDPSIPEIKADQDQLIQAFLNIVKNASQAINNKGTIVLKTRIQRNITIGEVCHRLAIKIDVTDDGPGITEDMQAKVFY
ncbi:MAG: PAS domain-containing protein, partial [Cycloclasticus sp.]|nr:PAS domain-containing protein [Cycloclasticus sp.]